MAHPVYVLLPAGIRWQPLAGTTAQPPSPVRWYLRQEMPESVTQTAVLIDDAEAQVEAAAGQIAALAEQLGGIAIDGHTQQVIEAQHRIGGVANASSVGSRDD